MQVGECWACGYQEVLAPPGGVASGVLLPPLSSPLNKHTGNVG